MKGESIGEEGGSNGGDDVMMGVGDDGNNRNKTCQHGVVVMVIRCR